MVGDEDMEKRIFVKGFPRETTQDDLKTIFEVYGTVKHVNIVIDRKNGMAKYGFVTFESKDVRNTLCKEKFVKFQDKTLCIDEAYRRKAFPEKIGDSAARGHGFKKDFQSAMDYSFSMAPIGYNLWQYRQNPVYVPTVQAPTIAQISSPRYQTGCMSSTHQVFTTVLVQGNPNPSTFAQSLNSGEQFLFQMPRASYFDGYHDYQTIPSLGSFTALPSIHDKNKTATESGMSILTNESISMTPKARGKKSFQPYVTKNEDEKKEAASESSRVPVVAVLPTTKEIISP
ncbi:RNA-binding protein 38-like [Dendronephthya gigantea]|uniref:RNA-binding protein 38-like n=1 Tax=Dendronephthya gigantea TaxID=151771 RepID=UPI00106B8F6A|nr:RNA-binding protein 38-like [Dendronephthya gigantea]